jgi:hypothetical protein
LLRKYGDGFLECTRSKGLFIKVLLEENTTSLVCVFPTVVVTTHTTRENAALATTSAAEVEDSTTLYATSTISDTSLTAWLLSCLLWLHLRNMTVGHANG